VAKRPDRRPRPLGRELPRSRLPLLRRGPMHTLTYAILLPRLQSRTGPSPPGNRRRGPHAPSCSKAFSTPFNRPGRRHQLRLPPQRWRHRPENAVGTSWGCRVKRRTPEKRIAPPRSQQNEVVNIANREHAYPHGFGAHDTTSTLIEPWYTISFACVRRPAGAPAGIRTATT
jgi:hypothetical protein